MTVFAYAAFKPCGCIAEVCTPRALKDWLEKEWFREQMETGKVRTIATREEFRVMTFYCEACKPKE